MSSGHPQGAGLTVYVGSYTKGKGQGIRIFRMNEEELQPAGSAPESESPAFLALHPARPFLYAVNEINNFTGQKTGAVSSFAIDPATGSLTLLNQQPSGGAAPCHLSVDLEGRNVLVANYSGGSVSVLPIQADGTLKPFSCLIQHKGSSVNLQRQEGPHAHAVYLDASGSFALVADLGLDQVLLYHFDPQRGMLWPAGAPAKLAPGAGPRHLSFHPNGRLVYCINEMGNTVTVFSYDPDSAGLVERQTLSTLPAGFAGVNHTSEIQVSPDGRFLYASNRGHDTIAVFRIDADGTLELAGCFPSGGRTPRSFCVDPTGRFLLAANQDSHNVVVFRIDSESGSLSPTGQVLEIPSPACVIFG